jgi:NADH dehydrogenase FAD-containing subunit
MAHYEHIRNDLGRRVEYGVQVRGGPTGAELLAELEEALTQDSRSGPTPH